MCNVCWQTPCDPRCPNAPDRILGECAECGEVICEYDDEVWEDDEGHLFCSHACASAYHGIFRKW